MILANSQAKQGFKDYTLLFNFLQQTLDSFDHETYLLMRELRQERSEILSWSVSVRRDIVKRHTKYIDSINEAMRKKPN